MAITKNCKKIELVVVKLCPKTKCTTFFLNTVYIQLYSPYRQPQNIEQLRRKRKMEKNREISHSQHSHNICRDIGLYLTDRYIYLNSL